jgi:fluoroacetyl-CoA thioesterase
MDELIPGLTGECRWTVTAAMTAAQVGSGLVAAFSTPMLVALMENAAVNALAGKLTEGQTSVGTRIDVQHLAATPVGASVHARATLTVVEGRRLTFEVEAWDDTEKIGQATHERFIIDRERFAARMAPKGQNPPGATE